MFNIKNADDQILKEIEKYNIFDFYRVVDVNTYLVYDWQGGEKIATDQRCYEVWKREDACKNCISRTCNHERRKIIKLECLEGQIYLIMAIPITLGEECLSLELICDVTDSLVVNDTFHIENLNAQDLILQMNDMAIRDSYTGLFNKRYAEQELCKSVLEWQGGNHLVVGVMDIDDFKLINDNFGHLQGDEILCGIAKIVDEYAVKGKGWASRIGGDEFMILWNDILPQEATEIVKELKEEIKRRTFIKGSPEASISVSIGLTEYKETYGDWREFLDEADRAMYRSKRANKGG